MSHLTRMSSDAFTVSFHNFKSQNFKVSVSNPKRKYVVVGCPRTVYALGGLGSHRHPTRMLSRDPRASPDEDVLGRIYATLINNTRIYATLINNTRIYATLINNTLINNPLINATRIYATLRVLPVYRY